MSKTVDEVIARLTALNPLSRDELKATVADFLADTDLDIIDSHNTKSMIFVFTADNQRYGLKLEYGGAKVTRDELGWYEMAPAELKKHYVRSHIGDNYAFILLKWLDRAQTVEEFAIASEGNPDNPTIELVLKVLDRVRLLFQSSPTVPLSSSVASGYFYEKYRSYNAEAVNFPYLQRLIDAPTVTVNGRELPGPERLVQAIQHNDELRNYLMPDKAGLIQGDPHMGNVLVQDDEVYFVDPKGPDPYPHEYDTGRIFWSLTGWNAIVLGEYKVEGSLEDGFTLQVTRRQQYVDGWEQVKAALPVQDYHRALYSCVMQYLTRVSHAAVETEATALYLRGLEVCADLLEEMQLDINEVVK